MELFMHPYRWLVFSKSSQRIVLPYNLNLLADSRFWSIESCNNSGFCVKYWYKLSKSDKVYIKDSVGMWTRNKQFVLYGDHIIFPTRKRINLNSTLIKTSFVVIHNDTLNHLTDYRFKSSLWNFVNF